MKILVYEWNSYLQYDIYAILKEKQVCFEIFSWMFRDKNEDEEFERWFKGTISISEFDILFSINYWPLLSKMCQLSGVKYVAWCYDNPLNVERIEETISNTVNLVFLFDRVQFLKYKNAGIDTVYHMPLGVNRTRLAQFEVSDKDYQRYKSEVSFVGNLYESHLQDIVAPLDEYMKGYITSLIDIQLRIYGYYFFDEIVTDEMISNINAQYKKKQQDTKFCLSKEALTFAMASEVTRRERLILLSLCGKRFDTHLFSYQDCELLVQIKKRSSVDYVREMPAVFRSSKINLNPSLKIIQTGIPLRAFDIMGAGGFLLSNYQEELLELYENERDLVVYESMEDAIEKIDFYLKHEDIRRKILENGRRKTLEEHSLQERLVEILKIVENS